MVLRGPRYEDRLSRVVKLYATGHLLCNINLPRSHSVETAALTSEEMEMLETEPCQAYLANLLERRYESEEDVKKMLGRAQKSALHEKAN